MASSPLGTKINSTFLHQFSQNYVPQITSIMGEDKQTNPREGIFMSTQIFMLETMVVIQTWHQK